MEVEGIDFAWTKPTAAEAKALGAHWAAGYYSTDATKNLTRALVSSYLAAGLAIVGVWETTTGRARQGYQAGIDDAGLADGERSSVGLPSDAVIYLAVDEDTDWASVAPYFNGASQVLGQARVGVYGGFRVIEGAAAAGYRYLWQTVAWSAGRWSSHATIRQEGGTVFGGNADIDFAEVTDFGQYPHLEVDVNLTDKMPAYAGIKQSDGTIYIPTVGECLNGAKTADAQIAALDAKVTTLAAKVNGLAVPGLTDAQVQALATQLLPALEKGLIPALLTAMGHKLDGTP